MSNKTRFSVGETVQLLPKWLPLDVRRKKVQIVGFQHNGTLTFAKIHWKGNRSKNYDIIYGDLFSIEELKKL